MPHPFNTFAAVTTNRVYIKDFLSSAQHQLIIDVRSPAEYNWAHLPGAVNIPLFTNEERKVVGTAYKQQSREIAIKAGLDFFGPKMKSIVEEVEKIVSSRRLAVSNSVNHQPPTITRIFLYCWRGGMRSAAVAWLLGLYGFNIVVLEGGYKAYRNYVLDVFALPYSLLVLGGYTGSGKTEVLHELKTRGTSVIDLEGLAVHRGSAFGSLGMPAQPTQEMFENLLALQLSQQNGKPIWIEDESQRIGLVNIPGTFWKTIREAPILFIDVPFEERLKHITAEYGTFDKEDLSNAIQRISKRLGGLETKNAHRYLEENNLKECFRILLKYYDKQYHKGLHSRDALPSLLTRFACEKVNPANASLLVKQPVA